MKKIFSLLFATVIAASVIAQPCSKLFFSEYIEGTGNNKALEIYNPTAVTVNLSGYQIVQYNNGAATGTYKFLLSGTIAAGDVYVIANSTADSVTIRPLADTITGSSAMNFNGNDVLALVNGTDTLDRIGQVGLSTDIVFDTTTNTGKDHSYVRKPTIQEGTTNWSLGKFQWIAYPVNTVNLGSHTMNSCGAITDTLVSFVPTGASVSESDGSYTINVTLNANSPAIPYSVDVVLTGGTGNAADINNYTTQTLTFSPGTSLDTLGITITDDLLTEPAETLIFRLSNPTNGLKLGSDSVFTLIIGASDAPVQVVTLSQITSLNSSFQPDSLGKVVITSGTVYGINYRATGLQFMLHDATDGIQVFSPSTTFGYAVNETDSIVIQGEVQFFNGTTQLANLDTLYKIGTGTLRAPLVVQDLDESTESELIRLNNVHLVTPAQWDTTGNPSGFSADITDGQNTWSIRIDEQTNIFKTNYAAPSATFDVIGIGTQFDNTTPYDSGYQILPRYKTDIILHSAIGEVNSSILGLYPNPNSGQFVIELNDAVSSEVKLFDLSGRMVYTVKANTKRIIVKADDLSPGIYIAEVRTANPASTSRIKVNIAK
jgi:hypothetical protein